MNESARAEMFEQVIADPLRFKQRLRIGRQAFRVLQTKDTLQDFWNAAGAGAAGATIASSSYVATTFFAPTGLMAWLGLATAATPVGWVLAAAIGCVGLYFCASRGLAADQRFVDEIPKFISTPLDLLGLGLFSLMSPLVIRVALVDGHFDRREREAILEHLIADWGYDRAFATQELARLEAIDTQASVEVLAHNLSKFIASNPDCNASEMQRELLDFVRELICADGIVRTEETAALGAINKILANSPARNVGLLPGVAQPSGASAT